MISPATASTVAARVARERIAGHLPAVQQALARRGPAGVPGLRLAGAVQPPGGSAQVTMRIVQKSDARPRVVK
jgi:hypothetical protein